MNSNFRDDRELAREVARELLAAARFGRHRADSKLRLRTLVRAGKAVGLGTLELADRAGLARQSIYELLRGSSPGSAEDADAAVLAVVAADGAVTRDALASSLGLSAEDVSRTVDELSEQGALKLASAGYSRSDMLEVVLLTDTGRSALERQLGRSSPSRPDFWTSYISVEPAEAKALLDAAERRFGRDRTALLPVGTVAQMTEPELALAFDASDSVDLFNQSAQAWDLLREDLSLPRSSPRIAAVSPPRPYSPTLNAFSSGMTATNSKAFVATIASPRAPLPAIDEIELCKRALFQAAWAFRRLLGQEEKPPALSDGESAFEELRAAASRQPTEDELVRVQQIVVRALKRATDRFGPFPGGRTASFRGPGEAANVVDEVTPSPRDLADIAQASGEVLGMAHKLSDGRIDAVEAVEAILETSPS